jgi:hypothetical protein
MSGWLSLGKLQVTVAVVPERNFDKKKKKYSDKDVLKDQTQSARTAGFIQ